MCSWHVLGGIWRRLLHAVSVRHHDNGLTGRQHLRFCVHDLRARLLWHFRVESRHIWSKRLLNMRRWDICTSWLPELHRLRSGHILVGRRRSLHGVPIWRNYCGTGNGQYVCRSLYHLRTRLFRLRHEPGHDNRSRLLSLPSRRDDNWFAGGLSVRLGLHYVCARVLWLCVAQRHQLCCWLLGVSRRHVRVRRRRFDVHCVPCWHHHDGRGHGQHLGLGLHCVRAGLLRSRDEPGHNKRGRLHGLPCRHLLVGRRHLQRLRLYCMPSWRHDGGRRRRQRLRCGLHYVRARLFWRRYEPGHNKRRRLLGMPRRHLLRGRRRLHLHVLSRGRHDRGRSDRQSLSLGLLGLRARLLRRRNEPGHNKRRWLLGMPRRHLLHGCWRLQRLHLHVLPRGHHDCWRGDEQHFSFALLGLRAWVFWLRHKPGNNERGRLRGLRSGHLLLHRWCLDVHSMPGGHHNRKRSDR